MAESKDTPQPVSSTKIPRRAFIAGVGVGTVGLVTAQDTLHAAGKLLEKFKSKSDYLKTAVESLQPGKKIYIHTSPLEIQVKPGHAAVKFRDDMVADESQQPGASVVDEIKSGDKPTQILNTTLFRGGPTKLGASASQWALNVQNGQLTFVNVDYATEDSVRFKDINAGEIITVLGFSSDNNVLLGQKVNGDVVPLGVRIPAPTK